MSFPFKPPLAPCLATVLYRNVQALANFMIGKSKTMSFDIPSLTAQRKDNSGVQQHILTMTPAERKILGISKSGLWYQKQKLMAGKPVQLYDKVLRKLSIEKALITEN